MPLRSRPTRELSDLRTLSSRSDTQIPAHNAYIRIGFLELERARRRQELRSWGRWRDAINVRLRRIDEEINRIYSNLDGTAPRARAIDAVRRSPVGLHAKTRRFRMTY